MTQGEKFIAIAENEERVFISGKEEGYAEGYIEGYNTAKEEAEEEANGYTVCIISYSSSRGLSVSTTKPLDTSDRDFIDEGSGGNYYEGTLENVTELYVWSGGVDMITVTFNDELIYETTDCSFEYAVEHPIPITASGTYYITGHY